MSIRKALIFSGAILILLPFFQTAPLCDQFNYNIERYTKGDTSNFVLYPESAALEPDVGICVHDAQYDTQVCKTADALDFSEDEIGDAVRPVYSRWRIDNSSGEYYFLTKDGETPKWSGKGQMIIFNAGDDSIYKIATEVNGHEGREFRWDYSGEHPTTMYYRDGCEFRSYDIVTGQTSLIHDFSAEFPECGRIINDVEGDSSADSRYWAWIVQGAYDGQNYPTTAIMTYDKATDKILGTLDHAGYKDMGGTETNLPRPNMVDISPLGTKVVCLWGRTNENNIFDGPHAYDFDFTDPVRVCNDETHSGWAFDKAGNEVYVCQINNWNWEGVDADTIAYTNILTGETHSIIYHEDLGWDVGGFHFGRFYNTEIRGWVYMTTYSREESQSWARNQAIMLEIAPWTENPRIWRITDTHNTYPGVSGYEREAYSPISGNGTTIWWASDWPGGDGTVDTYRLTLPDQWWIDIDGDNNEETWECVPKIAGNGMSGEITIENGGKVTISVSLDVITDNGNKADWWLVSYGPDGVWHHLDLQTMTFVQGLEALFQGNLMALDNIAIAELTDLSSGTHQFVFGLYEISDGIPNMESLIFDQLKVVVNN